LPAGRIAALGATMDLHHGLLAPSVLPVWVVCRERFGS
jgi:hypothetical protein